MMRDGSYAPEESGSSLDGYSARSAGAEVFLVCATHPYQSRDQCDLTFEAGDHFLVLDPPGPEVKWFHVITETGVPGYVPKTFVEYVHVSLSEIKLTMYIKHGPWT
jgi:hypothetical protein